MGKQKKLRSKLNKYPQEIEAELDLHGFSRQEAERELLDFIKMSRQSNIKKARVITGKGIHSTKGPVLRELAVKIFSQNNVSFQEAKVNEGGEGAMIIRFQ